jgi:hypothetical protein
MTDPVQMLIDAGAIPSAPFDANSRYNGVSLGVLQRRADDAPLAYVRRRFMPPRRSVAIAAEHLVRGGERPDTLAAVHLGEPLLYWRIADANAVIDPHELTDTVGARVLIPLPPGMSGA